MDFNLLIWAVYGFAQICFFSMGSFFNGHLPKLPVTIIGTLSYDFSNLCFFNLPTLGVYSFFILYVILRWRKILYEDLGRQISVQQTSAEPGDLRKMLAKTLENERQWLANLMDGIHRLQNYFLTAAGLRIKRNVAAWFIAVGLFVFAVLQTLTIWCRNPDYFIPNDVLTMFYCSLIWWILIHVMIQMLFFRVVSFGMNISEDESALKNTPPNISSEHWTLEELAPQSRRRIVYNAVVLLAAIPLCMLFQIEGWGIVRAIKMYFELSYPFPIDIDFLTIIKIETVLVALAVLWGSRYPRRRFFGYSLLFLVSGLTVMYYAEWTPFYFWVISPLNGFFFWWMDTESQNRLIRHVTMSEFYLHHCFALTWLIYSLLAAAICYGIHRFSSGQRTK